MSIAVGTGGIRSPDAGSGGLIRLAAVPPVMGVSRRTVLASAGVSTALLSGCLSNDGNESRAPRVVAVVARNFHEEPHRLTVELRHDGEQVHRSTHDLPAAEGRTWTEDRIGGPWGDGPGPLVTEVAVDEGETHTHEYADREPECFAFGPTVARDGTYDPRIALGGECVE